MDLEVTLQLQVEREQNPGENEFTIQYTVLNPVNIPAEIFVFQKNIDGTSEFHNVASPADLSTFPPDEPLEGIPFFRLSTACFTFETLEEAEQAFDRFISDVDFLVKNYEKLLSYIEGPALIDFPLPSAPLEE